MLKKKYRKVQTLAMYLKYRKSKIEIVKKPNLLEVLKKIQGKLEEKDILINMYKKEDICLGLRKIDIVEDESYATLLFAAGDKNIGDPAFWESTSDAIRNEKTRGGERISYTCHVIIYLSPVRDDELLFIVAKEDIPIFSVGMLSKFLNHLFSSYGVEKLKKNNGKKFSAIPKIEIEKLASKTIKDSLVAKIPIGIEAVYTEKKDSKHDENFDTKKKVKRLSLVPKKEWEIDTFIDNMRELIPSLSKYNEIFVRYKDNAKKQGSLKFDIEELEENDLNTYLFSQIHHVYLNKEIGHFSENIHEGIVKKMKDIIKQEYNLLTKNNLIC